MVMVSRGNETDKAYSILGTDMGRDEFIAKLAALEQSNPVAYDMVLNVVDRIKAVDVLDDPEVARKLDPARDDFVRSLQIYLLCTCADALMKPKAQGTRNRFSAFFGSLPQDAKGPLVGAFLIYCARGTGRLRDLDVGGLNTWANMSVDDRLKRVVAYLYEYHRNPFTHKAQLQGTVSPPKEQELIRLIEESLPELKSSDISYSWQDSSSKNLLTVILTSPVKALRQAIVEGSRACYLL